ncbi:hypothetical protein [Mycolicibacterium psychrotolerans]|nr:hypothetical protein [Mycolicibacterium psychrotolerans]
MTVTVAGVLHQARGIERRVRTGVADDAAPEKRDRVGPANGAELY